MEALIRTTYHDTYGPEELLEAKGDTTVAVCLPARDEAATVGAIVRTIRTHLVEAHALVDDLVVVDDHSTDATAARAAAEGARVVDASRVLPERGGGGKGRALWRSLFATDADVVIWCDADIRNFDPHFVTGLLGPLLTDPTISFVKGFYRRPGGEAGETGGRVTELTARPAIALLHPQISHIVQPLSGEYGGRRELLEQLPFMAGYGVDLGLLIDVVRTVGVAGLAQVDLGTRIHRNRPIEELGVQATEVLQVALRKVDPRLAPLAATLVRPGRAPVEVAGEELPPLVTLPSYRSPAASGS